MKKFYYLVLALFFSANIYSQLPNNNMYVINNSNLHPIPPQFGAPWSYAAVWGYVAPNGREYAIIGGGLGTSFFDVTDSANVREVDFFPSQISMASPDPGNIWREMKVYSHYAYIVSEADTSGVEIYDLQYLPDTVIFVKKFLSGGHRKTHTISQEGPYLYLNGANASFSQGTVVLDLTNDPTTPVIRGKWSTRYVHDCRVFRDTIYAMNINSGNGQITVIDAVNKDSLKTVTQWLNNPSPAPHNCDLTEDRKYLYATDEIGPLPRLLKVWNIQDLSNVIQVTTWQPTNITTARVHNVEIYGDTAVIAHYTAGIRVLNISNPAQPVEIAWYDTYPQNNGDAFAGCWGVFKFPSGKIVASDMNTGLYVLKIGKSVGINENNNVISSFRLEQNYPNPFNPVTVIRYQLAPPVRAGVNNHVLLIVYDVLGHEVATLVDENQRAGSYEVEWPASDFPSGVYYYKLTADGVSETRKMSLLK